MDDEKKKEEKIIYPSPIEDLLSDDGDFLYFEKGTRNSISFLEGNDLRIPKDYLADILRRRFVNEVEKKGSDDELAFLDDLTEEIIELFDKELKLFIQFYKETVWNNYIDVAYYDIIQTYISYVLKSELYREYMRINFVVQAVDEADSKDKKEYYSKLKHAVEYPGEGEKERLRHEKEIQAEIDFWHKAREAAKQKVKEESND